ncbi:MAG TPA: beta-propeller domain-containing protein, partial [Kofleriaceae bacterium]|nr:beta-propeller domain-containing protein [Kofleriaceae bacterium]
MRRFVFAYALVFLVACSDSDTPQDHVLAHSTELHQYNSCSDLESDLKGLLTHEVWADIDYADENLGYGEPGTDGAGAGDSNTTSGGGRQEGVDYSGTNNQVQGVDEADLVKTDGYHLYALNGNRLHIFGTPNFGDLVPESVTQLEGHPTEMLLDSAANRAVVFSMINVYALPDGHPLKQLVGWQADTWYWRISELTKITVLDITDHTAP